VITKRTDELRPGDVIRIQQIQHDRTVLSLSPRTGERFVITLEVPLSDTPDRITAHEAAEWEVREPELPARAKLDLAVQRANELADQWFNTRNGVNGREISEMFDLFRAAR
jgi:hypothetical protein